MPKHSGVLQAAEDIVAHREKLVTSLNGEISAGRSGRCGRFGDGGRMVNVVVVGEKHIEDGFSGT